jgi:signal transduction histidine kinase
MNATAPLELLLRRALERLDREEQRADALESLLLQLTPPRRPARSITDTPTPVKRLQLVRVPPPAPESDEDRVCRLEARARAAEERLRETEHRLRQARRLEAVGKLVAGVAHDFNNLLAVIGGAAEVVRDGLPAGDALRDHADLIAATARTAGGVSRQLLSFARPARPDPGPVDVAGAVRGLERVFRRLTGDRVRLVLDIGPTPPVLTDAGQVDQVLLNLVINARDAIPDRGTVTVRTGDMTIAPGHPDLPPGGHVVLTVADTGVGMPDEVRAKAFDAFFSTKGGSGLGLATVRDAVRSAGGHVEVESAPAGGTTVRAYWPRAVNSVRLISDACP